ncbi:PH domain-containing protein [Fructobacillus evanidus]
MAKVIHPKCMAKLGIKKLDLKKQGQIKHEPYEYLQELYNNGEKYDFEKAKNDRLKYLRDDVPDEPSQTDDIQNQLEEAGVSNLFGTKKEINHLHEYLDPQEKIVYAVSGGREGRSYLIVITNNRLMFINKNMFVGGDYEEIGFDYINAVSYSSKFVLSTIMITNGANTIAIENVDKHNAPIFVEKLKKAVQDKTADNQQLFQAQQPVQPQPQTSNLGQIKELKELLDMGAITQEEFDLKKKELLGI